ncbi:MAG: response regulator transcription factor [Chloroflexales bacterium]|nr:response regulator transcription factor [Chloroflexales bacterium]
MRPRILLIEDDPAMVQMIQMGLRYVGFEVLVAANGSDGLDQAYAQQPDLVLLDWMLPGLDGLTVCRRLRQMSSAPIVMLTARDAVDDRVQGLDAGADDYIVKPVHLEELAARLRARLRHLTPASEQNTLTFADLALDLDLREAARGSGRITLTATEFSLLHYLLRHPRQVLTKDTLLEVVWGYDSGNANLVEQYVRSLRRKLGEPPLIHTVRGMGYVLREEA